MKPVSYFFATVVALLAMTFSACDRERQVDIRGNQNAEDDSEEMTREVFASGRAEVVENAQVESFFVKLSEATRADREFQTEEFFSIEAMLACLEQEGVLGKLNKNQRTIRIAGMAMVEMMNPPAAPWVAKFVTLTRTLQQNSGDMMDMLQNAVKPARDLIDSNPPREIKSFGYVMLVSGTMMDDVEKALELIEDAEADDAMSPILWYHKGITLSELGRDEEALVEWDKYIELLGRDSDILELMADSHFTLGNMTKSKELALEGLRDNPKALGCLSSLVLPLGKVITSLPSLWRGRGSA